MNRDPVREVLSELFRHLERLETQSTAISLFLKEQKHITDKQLAPYLERAGKASNVRWRAERVRMEYLLTQTDVLTGAAEKTESEKSAPSEVEQKAAREEQAWQGGTHSGSTHREKTRAEDEGREAAHGTREAGEVAKEVAKEEQPEHDSTHRTEVQAEAADESRDGKKEGGQKVA
ncbi:MAG TPA: hypothetical protein VKH81_04910 [Candidatus Angelobacter sp.]|nr:hypothetical protein [Candidatus Angelobacter sp.]